MTARVSTLPDFVTPVNTGKKRRNFFISLCHTRHDLAVLAKMGENVWYNLFLTILHKVVIFFGFNHEFLPTPGEGKGLKKGKI